MVGWNNGATEIFGYSEPEALGKPMSLLILEDLSWARLSTPSLLSKGCEIQTEGRLPAERWGRRKDGTIFPLEFSLAGWKTASGSFATAIVRDITARKQAEQQVQLQSTALSAAINSVVITDVKGNIQWVNPAFCRITGYTFEEAVGQNPRVLKSGVQSKEYYATMWRTIASGKSWSGEFVNRRKDGSLFTEAVSITPVRSERGVILHYIAIKEDISALKKSLSDLGRAHEELEAKNVVLDNALVEARTAAGAKAAFLSTISHELRTPMNGVIGMTSLLRETKPLSDEQRDYIDIITSSGDILLTLINDVPDFSKIEASGMKMEWVSLNIRHSLDETLKPVAVRAREKGLNLAVDIAPAVPAAFMGDPVRLRQVISNLVDNAIKFTSKGEVVVELRSKRLRPGIHRLFFRIRDSGIGIGAEKIGRLFKSFSQVDSSMTRIYGGTGLGLAISQRLVGLMGGQIEVSSELGMGSVFFFDFEVAEAPRTEPLDGSTNLKPLANRRTLIVDYDKKPLERPRSPEVAPTAAKVELRATAKTHPRKILLAEDNPVNRKLAGAMLRRLGYEADVAQNGVEAVAACQSRTYDLVLMDVQMPELDGLEATRRIRAAEERQPVIVAMTANAMKGDRDLCLEAGMDDYLTKPVKLTVLREVIISARHVDSTSAASTT